MTINQIREKLTTHIYNESVVQSNLISLDEWIDMTDKLFSPSELKVFTKLDAEYAGEDGEIALLSDALESDISLKYLIYRCMDCINNAFFHYFLGPNPRLQKKRIDDDGWSKYISCVYNVLKSKTANPILAFDYDKVRNSKGDVLRKFKWYLDKYLKAECIRFNKADTGDAGNLSFEAGYIDEYENDLYTDSFEDEYEDVEGYYNSFVEVVDELRAEKGSEKNSSTYSILKYLVMHNFAGELKDIAPALGIAAGQVSWKKKEIFNAFTAHDIGAKELQSLIVHPEFNRKIKQLFR